MADVTTDSPRYGFEFTPHALRFGDGDRVTDEVRDALLGVATQLGRDLTITSGYRGPRHPAERKKSRPGEHNRGRAVDIRMAGLSTAEKRQLVEQLAQRGFNYFGTYSRLPHMLHSDMRPPAGYFNCGKPGFPGQKHFTHNGKQAHLSKAPAWFQEIAKTGGMDLTNIDVVPTPRPDPNAPEPKSALDSLPVRSEFPVGMVEGYRQYARSRGVDSDSQPTPQALLEYFGPPAPRSDYPTGPTDPAPWVDDFAPAPAYPPQMASRERFEKTFAPPDPHAPVLQPGMSDRARAMRDLADKMARADIAGLDGRRVAAQSAEDEGPGLGSVEVGMPPAPHTYDSATLHRVPIPKARPGGYRPMPAPVPRRRPVAPSGAVPVPTARPEPMGWPKPSSIPVPRPAPRRGAGLAPQHDAIAPLGPYASGPKKQIFDFVLGKLLNPGRPAN